MSGCLDGEEFLLLFLLWKPLNFSFDFEWLPRLENFWLASFSFSIIPISCHSLLTCKVSAKNLLIALWDFLCIEYRISCFYLSLFKILSLSFTFFIVIIMHLILFSFWVHIIWNFLEFLDLDICFFPQIQEVFSHYLLK